MFIRLRPVHTLQGGSGSTGSELPLIDFAKFEPQAACMASPAAGTLGPEDCELHLNYHALLVCTVPSLDVLLPMGKWGFLPRDL